MGRPGLEPEMQLSHGFTVRCDTNSAHRPMMTPAGFEPDISWLRTRNPEPLDEGAKEKTACVGKIRNRRLSDNISDTVCIMADQGILFVLCFLPNFSIQTSPFSSSDRDSNSSYE